MPQISRAPEVENIKELPAAELFDGLPKNQCPWCGLIQQGSTSVHRKFCMKMPIRMWLAKHRELQAEATMKTETESLAATVDQFSRRHMREPGMKNNAVKGSQPCGWKRTRVTSFRHRGKTRVSAKKSE